MIRPSHATELHYWLVSYEGTTPKCDFCGTDGVQVWKYTCVEWDGNKVQASFVYAHSDCIAKYVVEMFDEATYEGILQ